MLTLYITALSANGRKVLAVCRQLELEPEIRDVNVYRGEGRTAEYLAVNPSGKIPTLVDGDFPIASFPFKDHPPFMDWYTRVEALEGWRATRHPLWSV